MDTPLPRRTHYNLSGPCSDSANAEKSATPWGALGSMDATIRPTTNMTSADHGAYSVGPRLEAGGRFGMTLAAGDRRLANATVTLQGEAAAGGFVNGHAMLHHRWFPAIELDGRDSMSEVVTMSGINVELGPVYAGEATLELFDSPTEELTTLAPEEILGGYFRTVGTTFAGGRTLSSL